MCYIFRQNVLKKSQRPQFSWSILDQLNALYSPLPGAAPGSPLGVRVRDTAGPGDSGEYEGELALLPSPRTSHSLALPGLARPEGDDLGLDPGQQHQHHHHLHLTELSL